MRKGVVWKARGVAHPLPKLAKLSKNTDNSYMLVISERRRRLIKVPCTRKPITVSLAMFLYGRLIGMNVALLILNTRTNVGATVNCAGHIKTLTPQKLLVRLAPYQAA